MPHPWTIEEKYPVGSILKEKLFGLLILAPLSNLNPVDGLVHISQISENRVDKVEDVLQTGDTVSVKVLDVKPEDRNQPEY